MIYRLLYVHRRRMVSRTTHDLLFDPVPCLSSPTVSQRLTHTQFLLSSSYLMISQGKKDEVLRVGSSRNSSAFPYISLFFFCFFFFFSLLKEEEKLMDISGRKLKSKRRIELTIHQICLLSHPTKKRTKNCCPFHWKLPIWLIFHQV